MILVNLGDGGSGEGWEEGDAGGGGRRETGGRQGGGRGGAGGEVGVYQKSCYMAGVFSATARPFIG